MMVSPDHGHLNASLFIFSQNGTFFGAVLKWPLVHFPQNDVLMTTFDQGISLFLHLGWFFILHVSNPAKPLQKKRLDFLTSLA